MGSAAGSGGGSTVTQILIIYGTQLGDRRLTCVEARRGRARPALCGGENAARINTKARGCAPEQLGGPRGAVWAAAVPIHPAAGRRGGPRLPVLGRGHAALLGERSPRLVFLQEPVDADKGLFGIRQPHLRPPCGPGCESFSGTEFGVVYAWRSCCGLVILQ